MSDRVLPAALQAILPNETQEAWRRIAPVLPETAYLVGGTAVAVHLGHRPSRDLDFFTTTPFDPEALRAALSKVGDFEPTLLQPGTLNGLFEGAKIQVLDAHQQTVLGPPMVVAGIRIAGMRDLLATKVKVIGDRGELRDYFDLMTIEERTSLRFEDGLRFYLARYHPRVPESAVSHILRALGSFGDVADDPSLPLPRARIEQYWRHRQPQVVAAVDALLEAPDAAPAESAPAAPASPGEFRGGEVVVREHQRRGRTVREHTRRRPS